MACTVPYLYSSLHGQEQQSNLMCKLFVERLLVSSVLALSVAASKLLNSPLAHHNGFKEGWVRSQDLRSSRESTLTAGSNGIAHAH